MTTWKNLYVILPFLLQVSSVLGQDIALHRDSVVRFASVEQGEEVLDTRDRFLTALSPFDRQSRLETDRDVPEAEFVQFIRSQVRPWSEPDRAKLATVMDSLRTRLMGLKIPFPKSIWLVKTTGREEGNAAYCRKQAVIIPQGKLDDAPDELARLLTHELFHIASAHDPDFRATCYQLIGFRIVPPIEYPDSLRERKLTNPDGPLADSIMDVSIDGQPRTIVPILYSSEQRFNRERGGPFFKYLTFRLLVVEPHEGRWRPAQQNDQPWLLGPGQVADFGRQIGANTGYIIHPDEILADNFVHLVYQTPKLRSPEIVENMRKKLTSP